MAGRADETGRRGRGSAVPPSGVDLSTPSIARVYDYILGGKEHFEIDRRATDAIYTVVPQVGTLARENRNLLRRATRYLVREAGVRQIIDLGSGLPTLGNVHEIAHEVDPKVRVVYVDNDPVVLTHGRALLSQENTTTMIMADIRDPDSVFDNPPVKELIDFDEPFAVIASSILHHLTDAEAHVTAEGIKERLTAGSYLLTTNFLDDDEDRAKDLEKAFLDGGLGTGRFRTWAELRRFFDGLEMLEPGLVYGNDWHPDEFTPADSPVHTLYSAGMARKVS
jgi:S-adenosyl methyltransferase